MREVALYDAKNSLSALVAEVEASGAEIVITRHGKPAAKLVPISAKRTDEERAAAFRQILANRDARALAHPETTIPISWEELKADMYPED